MSYEEFKNNSPSITEPLVYDKKPRKTDIWKGTFSIIPKYASNDKKVKGAWGFCDGKQSYVSLNNNFFKLDLSNGEMNFLGYKFVSNQDVNTAAFAGGIVGSIITIEEAKIYKIAYVIMQEQGEIITRSELEKYTNVDRPEVDLTLYRYGKNELSEVLTVFVNDSISVRLEPYSFVELKIKISREPLIIQYSDSSAILVRDILEEGLLYIEASKTDQNKEKVLKLRDPEGGLWAKNKIKKYQRKANAKK